MAKFKFIDKRENIVLTFGTLSIGDIFTSVDGEVPFVKTEVMYDLNKDPYNTVALDGEFYWSDDDEEVEPIRELEIVIKK